MTHRARRGDEVERWLRRRRDAEAPGTDAWHALDGALDDYRLHADVGAPLHREVGVD